MEALNPPMERLNAWGEIMKLSHFFIDRPIFESVISIVTVTTEGNCLYDVAGGTIPRDRAADGSSTGADPKTLAGNRSRADRTTG
jgi:hypothetical protein